MQASQLHTISLGPPASDWTLLQNFVSTKTSSWVEKFAKQWGRFLVTRFLSNKAGKALQKQAHNFEIFSLSHLNSYFLIDLLLNLQTFPWIIYSRSQQSSFYSITPTKKHLKAKRWIHLHYIEPQLPYLCFRTPWHILTLLIDQSKHHNSKHQAPNFPSWQTLINNGNKKTPQNEWREKRMGRSLNIFHH